MRQRRSSIEEFKIQARLLKKAISSEEESKKSIALSRFHGLPTFQDIPFEELSSGIDKIKLKHALEVIAVEHGYSSWKDLLSHEDVSWYREASPFILNWFANYDEAKVHQREHGGYLLPYKNQFLWEQWIILNL